MSASPSEIALVAEMFPALATAWRGMARCELPRNVKAIVDLPNFAEAVVSFVGKTSLPLPHVFVESGRRCDLRPLTARHVFVAIRKGIDASQALADLTQIALPYVTLPVCLDTHIRLVTRSRRRCRS